MVNSRFLAVKYGNGKVKKKAYIQFFFLEKSYISCILRKRIADDWPMDIHLSGGNYVVHAKR